MSGRLGWHLLQHRHRQLKCLCKISTISTAPNQLCIIRIFSKRGFEWIVDNRHSVVSFIRRAQEPEDFIITVCNFTPQPHSHYRIGVPEPGFYTELFNSDAREYGGSNMGILVANGQMNGIPNRPYRLTFVYLPRDMILKLNRQETAALMR